MTTHSPISYPYAYGHLSAIAYTVPNQFAIECELKGLTVPAEAIEVLRKIMDAAQNSADAKGRKEYLKWNS